MKQKLRVLGLDVNTEAIAIAAAQPDGRFAAWVRLPREESFRKFIKELGLA